MNYLCFIENDGRKLLSQDASIRAIQERIHQFPTGKLVHMSAFGTQQQWLLTREAKGHMQLFWALLRAAYRHFNLVNCVGARFGSGLEHLPNAQRMDGAILFCWSRKGPENVFQFYGHNTGAINLRKLIDVPSKELVVLQFLLVNDGDSDVIKHEIPDVPMLCAPSPSRSSPEPMELLPPPSPPSGFQPFDLLGPRAICDRDGGSS